MHESLRLYDAALEVLAGEMDALENEDEERLLELSGKRAALVEEAWEKREGCPSAPILERLNTLREAQVSLTAKASAQAETLRLSLKDSRQESTRLAGYGKALGSRQSMSLLHKEG